MKSLRGNMGGRNRRGGRRLNGKAPDLKWDEYGVGLNGFGEATRRTNGSRGPTQAERDRNKREMTVAGYREMSAEEARLKALKAAHERVKLSRQFGIRVRDWRGRAMGLEPDKKRRIREDYERREWAMKDE